MNPLIEYERTETDSPEFEAVVKVVTERYDACVDVLKRGHDALYSFLGCVYENAERVDSTFGLRGMLIADVSKALNHGLKKRSRWKPENHDTYDLLLTLKTGLSPDLAASKSQWLGALRAAKSRKGSEGQDDPVDPTESAFVDWVAEKGVIAAAKPGKRSSGFNLCEFAEGIAPTGTTVTIDLPIEATAPEDVVELLGRIRARHGGQAEVEILGVILDEKRVRSSSAWLEKHIDQENRVHARRLSKAMNKFAGSEYGDPNEKDLDPDKELTAEDLVRLSEET
ncbi:hypothetical protein [Sphingomonas alba]|uniref:Uncharacterized protein n=1 Tax=Sphingomonas alba TaxID=2908208 RepID=A0ABT0RN69_9SPHN|nr:hypothetical protein [Sphingomonas alba]MCL6684096.1 hypothetical protein [Sphingomonas alba]